MKRRMLVMSLIITCSLNVFADVLIYEFSGHINEINENENNVLGDIQTGQSFSGWFSYSTSVPDQRPDTNYGTYHQDASIQIDIGGLTLSYLDDFVYVRTQNGISEDSFGFAVDAQQGDYNFTYFGLELIDSEAGVFDTDAIPLALDLSHFDSPVFILSGSHGPYVDYFSLRGQITSLELVPEPCTLAMLALGGFLIRRRRVGVN